MLRQSQQQLYTGNY